MDNKRKLAELIIDNYYSISFKSVKWVDFIENEIRVSFDKDSDGLEDLYSKVIINSYEYATYLKETIENYAHQVRLKGIWIDLNDLSKDEKYYFNHCYEVFEDLIKYEKSIL